MLVAFDLDGVLYSTEPFLTDAYREAIDQVNAARPGSFARVPTTREIFQHIGWPVPTILARLFPDADQAAVALMYTVTLDVICTRVAAGDGVLFPGVAQTLAQLEARGHVLVVASNGRRRYVETVLRTYGLQSHFAPLLSVDGEGLADKPSLLAEYLRCYRVDAPSAVMVGDRASDVEAAEAVGCRFIGCDYGHGHRSEIEGHGLIVSSFAALLEVMGE